MTPRSFELFAGAGGLALGLARAGFTSAGMVEWNAPACRTIRENAHLGHPAASLWPLQEGDVREADLSVVPEDLHLLAGGPPCQPFSLGGRHGAQKDGRDMFPATVDVVRRLRPRAFLLENVRGLTRPAFGDYLDLILLRLAMPEEDARKGESPEKHLARLKRLQNRGGPAGGLRYDVRMRVVNAADYGIPQRRERVFIVGFRSDLRVEWEFPAPTHSREALLHDLWIDGAYWERHGVPRKDRVAPDRMHIRMLERMRGALLPQRLKPWRTVRDALAGLPDPRDAVAAARFHNHRFQPGARPSPGHTGSPPDWPSKTIKAGAHGVPGGENMLATPLECRYFTVRESARIQTFPDDYVFPGSWTESMRQIGNAVPAELAAAMAGAVAKALQEHDIKTP